ncbi:MAG: hypothetical protein AAFU61_04485 [Pseudomonadota bacterium]
MAVLVGLAPQVVMHPRGLVRGMHRLHAETGPPDAFARLAERHRDADETAFAGRQSDDPGRHRRTVAHPFRAADAGVAAEGVVDGDPQAQLGLRIGGCSGASPISRRTGRFGSMERGGEAARSRLGLTTAKATKPAAQADIPALARSGQASSAASLLATRSLRRSLGARAARTDAAQQRLASPAAPGHVSPGDSPPSPAAQRMRP